jgi:spore maturation protein SpmA
MLNYIWLGLIVLAVAIGGATQHLKEVSEAAFENARNAVVDLALPLVGVMALWLGLMRLAEKGGLVQLMARGMRPVLRWLFPEVPEGDPALGSILMNVSANMLGLANAATPLGLRAMKDLERLNPHPGTATNAMCTFLAINTSSVQLIPASTIAILASQGSKAPTAIIGTALVASACANVVALTAVKLLQHLPVFAPGNPAAGCNPATPAPEPAPPSPTDPEPITPRPWALPALLAVGLFFGWAVWAQVGRNRAVQPLFPATVGAVSLVAVPFLMLFMTVFAASRGVRVYEQFVEGAREGFDTAIRIIPYLVAILVAMGMFRAAGGIEMVTRALDPVLSVVHFPTELVPLALVRPLSGSGANGLFAELVRTHGPDSLIARTAGTLIGSTETTFYVLAVYFGSVGIRRTRHAVAVGLLGDLAGMIAAVTVCRMAF